MSAEVRAIAAAGPGPQPETLRRAYLELLKLCLCDLTGAATREVRWTEDKRWFSRELTGDAQFAGRTEGKDFPLDGLTMVGLRRLDALQASVEAIVRDDIDGDLIEAGVWRGGASILTRATLDSLGASERVLWLADSFEGFAPPDQAELEADRTLETDFKGVDYFAPGLGAVQSYFARFGLDRGVKFAPGFFEDTLRHFRGKRWALIRVDADTFKATKLALEALYPGLAPGGYVVLDDYFHPWLPQCRQAVDEFRAEHGITQPVEQIDWNGGRWRRADETLQPESSELSGLERIVASPTAEAKPPPRIPTDRELQLGDELAETRARMYELESQLEHLRRFPLARIRCWARRRLG